VNSDFTKYFSFFITIIAFFLDNHREYIEKIIKSIAKVKYKDTKKRKKKRKTNLGKKRKKIDLLQQITKILPKISYYTII
jgi:hypothetical protein